MCDDYLLMRYIMLSELMDELEDILPDLTEIGGLGLNWDNLFDCCNEDYPYPNFGIDDLYSIGASGHDYLVFVAQPKTAVDRYPIALFNEERGTSRIIASSVKTWFPCYLAVRTDALLHVFNESEDADEKKKAEKELDALYADKVKIEKFAEEFGNKAFLKALPAVFESVSKKSLSSWDFAALHRIADGGSYLDDCIDLQNGKAAGAAIKTFVKKYPRYNGIIPFLAANAEQAGKSAFDKETAMRVFSSPVTSDLGGRDAIYAILRLAASALRVDESYEETPFAGLVDELCDCEDPCIAHFYYEAGIDFANEGDLLCALSCYENAIFFSWAEEGSFHAEAFDEICYLAQEIDDKNYLSFIRSLHFEGEADDEELAGEEDDEPDFPASDTDEEPKEEDDDDEDEEEDEKKSPKKKTTPAKKKSR